MNPNIPQKTLDSLCTISSSLQKKIQEDKEECLRDLRQQKKEDIRQTAIYSFPGIMTMVIGVYESLPSCIIGGFLMFGVAGAYAFYCSQFYKEEKASLAKLQTLEENHRKWHNRLEELLSKK